MSAVSFDAQIMAAFSAELARHQTELARHAAVMADLVAFSRQHGAFTLDLVSFGDARTARH